MKVNELIEIISCVGPYTNVEGAQENSAECCVLEHGNCQGSEETSHVCCVI